MSNVEAFVQYILSGGEVVDLAPADDLDNALPDGLEGFDRPAAAGPDPSSFARRLLEGSGFQYPDSVGRRKVIRSSDPVSRHLPESGWYWPETTVRKYATLLFETDLTHTTLLAIPAFKNRQIAHLDIVEDALARLANEVLEGFARGGDAVNSGIPQVPKTKTLCVLSILDNREGHSSRLVCFATWSQDKDGGLETFYVSEELRYWEQTDQARELLTRLYDRQFSKLNCDKWQDAFTTSQERDAAVALQTTCSDHAGDTELIHNSLQALINLIAKSYGHAIEPTLGNPLAPKAFDHDIGIDPKHPADLNPIPAVTLRDSHQRLLGYILYALKDKAEADALRESLKKHNRFHNVLVVYPASTGADGVAEVNVELWQGNQPLVGKLRKGQGHKGAAEIVNLLSRFFVVSRAKVKDPEELAKELAFRARYLRRVALHQLDIESDSGPLRQLFKAFGDKLIHGQTKEQFADAFAQTLTYSLLTARWIAATEKDVVPERFTRETAKKHLTHGSHFLSEVFNAALASPMAGQQTRLDWLIDDVADLLDRLDIKRVFKDEAEATAPERKKDQIIHFYEPFLKEYDPDIKRQRGVFYTPWQVVSYIVRSVHEVLQTEFGLEDGLADVATWGDMAARVEGLKIPAPCGEGDRFVTILDPATGTGTFLVECVDVIHKTMTAKWALAGMTAAEVRAEWNRYVPEHLIPRLHGFELLVAPYAVAHLKLRMKLAETGYLFGGVVPEIKVFLTNALEPGEERAQLTLDPSGIALEGKLANRAKTEQRFSVILGNPPYANFGRMNRNPHILKLLATYKEGLGEKKLNLDDDFIKFIRQAEHTILTSGVGVCGMITNNTFMEAPTRRGMRARLMEDFQVIFVTDLHGNSIERETCPDGSPDDNVFEIQQGVAVSVLIRKSGITSQDSCIIHHRDFYGTREVKQRDLLVATVLSSSMTTLRPIAPQFAFQPSTFPHSREYLGFIPLAEVFNISGSGVKTDRDALCFDFDRDLLETRMKLAFSGHNDLDFVERFRIEDSSSFDLTRRLREGVFRKESIKPCLYRLFDERWLYYERGFTSRPAWDVMQHMLGDNRALLAKRQARDGDYSWVFVTKSLVVDGLFSIDNKGREQIIPLYIFDTGALTNGPRQGATRTNFAAGFLRLLKETFWTSADERWGLPIGISPENCFDYIYAILHSPTYRSRYYLGLKEDFPRIPLAASIETFQALSGLGSSLVAAHLLGDGLNPPVSIAYLGTPNPQIGACNWKDGAIWLETAAAGSSEDIAALRNRFVGVAESTWTFHIGGHQVCKKWLDDRRKAGRTLSADDITHYQKIIAAITETIRIMAEIDEVIDAQGGWPAAFLTTPVETP